MTVSKVTNALLVRLALKEDPLLSTSMEVISVKSKQVKVSNAPHLSIVKIN
jgi:hypothetical protein